MALNIPPMLMTPLFFPPSQTSPVDLGPPGYLAGPLHVLCHLNLNMFKMPVL